MYYNALSAYNELNLSLNVHKKIKNKNYLVTKMYLKTKMIFFTTSETFKFKTFLIPE